MSKIDHLKMDSSDSGHRVSYLLSEKKAGDGHFDMPTPNHKEFLFSEGEIEKAIKKYKEILKEMRGEEDSSE